MRTKQKRHVRFFQTGRFETKTKLFELLHNWNKTDVLGIKRDWQARFRKRLTLCISLEAFLGQRLARSPIQALRALSPEFCQRPKRLSHQEFRCRPAFHLCRY